MLHHLAKLIALLNLKMTIPAYLIYKPNQRDKQINFVYLAGIQLFKPNNRL